MTRVSVCNVFTSVLMMMNPKPFPLSLNIPGNMIILLTLRILYHHEIDLSNPRKLATVKLKTVGHYSIKRVKQFPIQ